MVAMVKVAAVLAVASGAEGPFYFPQAAEPLGGDVVTYDGAIEKSRPAKPGYLETFVDPYFGSKVTRVSGDRGQPIPVIGGAWPQDCRSHYQKDPPWNADGNVLYLNKGCRMFLDGQVQAYVIDVTHLRSQSAGSGQR